MRYLYSFIFYLILPFLFIRLGLRSLRMPIYRQRMLERLGYYPYQLERSIWVHAVSVGETLAAIPLIKALKAAYPAIPILVTTMTPTGAERVERALGDSVHHVFIPYDVPSAVKRFINTMHPVIAIIMETELWPNMIHACHEKKIPLCLVNARLSAKSAQGYQRISSLTKAMLQSFEIIAAHGKEDADRFIALGAHKDGVVVTGNIKFDLEIAADLAQKGDILRENLGRTRFVWIAASTHQGEEEMVLKAHQKLRAKNQDALLILVPRHPDRFDAVFKLANASFNTKRRSLHEVVTNDAAVYLGDTMGELMLLYAAADVAFVGGSLIPRGGHNMLEPGALKKPIITGPSLFNFAEISALFINANALIKVTDGDSLAETLIKLMMHQEELNAMGERAYQVVAANKGALNKQLAEAQKILARVLN